MLKNKINILLLALFCAIQIPNIKGQTPAASANFEVPELEITTTPEHPGICNFEVGTKIQVNETFLSYKWISPTGQDGGSLSKVQAKESGLWTVNVSYQANGVICSMSKKILVANLTDNQQIKQYFEQAEFWPITIYKNLTTEPACRSCPCDAMLEDISFISNGTKIQLRNDFENFSNFQPLKGMNYNKNITNNQCLCNEDGTSNIEQLEESLSNSDLGLWGHQFFESDVTEDGTLYIKAKMSWQEKSPVGQHRARLNSIKETILTQNDGTKNQAKVFFTNLFMTNPIGGYNLATSCPDPEGCFAEGNFLTPAGVLTKLPDGAQFAFGDGTNGGPRGALLAYIDNQGNSRQAYNYKSDAFAGFYHDLSATVTSDLETVGVSTEGNDRIVLIEKGNSECFKSLVPYKAGVANSDSWGGIGYNIIQNNTINAITPKVFESVNPGEIKIAFMAPTAGIISIERSFSNIEFNYTKTENATVENFVGGMLWSFDQLNHETCEINSFEYQPGGSFYLDKVANVIYQDNHGDAENFEYIMACNGTYNSYSLKRGSLENHADGSPNYDNNFDGLTDLFIPFSPQNDIAGASSTVIGKVPSCAFCPSQEFNQLIIKEKYCLHPEHIFVEKIAQIATVYPSNFTDIEVSFVEPCLFSFTQKNSWEIPITGTVILADWWSWSRFLQDNRDVEDLFENDNVLFFKTFLNEMSDEIKKPNLWWNQDIANKTLDEIICHIRGEPQNITETIPWDRKQIALNILYSVNQNSVQRNDAEHAIIHLLASSTNNEAVSHILSKKLSYYWQNFRHLGNENLSSLLHLICSKSALTYSNMSVQNQNWNTLLQLEANFFTFSNLEENIIDNKILLNGIEYTYNKIIPVQMAGRLEIGGKVYNEGAILYLPSVIVAMLARENDIAVAERLGWVALDIGTLAVGFGAARFIFPTATILRRGFISAELAGSILGLTGQLVDNLTSEERARIQFAALVASGPEIGISITEAVTATRLLRKPEYATKPFIKKCADEVRLALAENDLSEFSDALLFVRTNSRGADAWEMLLRDLNAASDILRRNRVTLEWFAKNGASIPVNVVDDFLSKVNKPLKEVIEDAQGRLTIVLDRPGQSNQVVSMHKDFSGNYRTTVYDPAYNPVLNSTINVPLSANKITPNYIKTQYMHPLQGDQVVRIKLSGSRNTDFSRARAELGISSADETVNGVTHTWHHMDDFEIINGEAYGTMQLVQSSAHQGTAVTGMQHSGSPAQWRAYYVNASNAPNNLFYTN